MSTSPHTPQGDGIFLDHLAHWIPDLAAGAADLERLGFLLTPYTEHTHSPAPGAPVEPAGTANHCIMLREGYLEILTATRDTPLAKEIRARLARHVGLHLAAFCVNDAAAERERLVAQGFPQRPLVALERDAELADGSAVTLRFTVVRPEPGLLPEGRVQFLSQHTPQWVWEERWLDQPNGAQALTDLLMCVDDPDECADRYARYLRTDAQPLPDGGHVLRFQRGALSILTPRALRAAMPDVQPHPTPCMAGYALRVTDLSATDAYLQRAGFAVTRSGDALVLSMPASLGGVLVFHAGGGPPWRQERRS